MKKIKNEKGITLVTLTITIVVLMILSFSINVSVKSTMETRNYNYVKEDIINLSEEVKAYYLKNNSLPIDKTKTYNLTDYGVPSEDINPNDSGNYYRIKTNMLNDVNLNNGGFENNDANEETNDMYVVNETTLTVYYLRGVTFGGQKHYTITDEFSAGGLAEDNYSKTELPIISSVTMQSDNTNKYEATVGNKVTLKIVSNYKLTKTPTITIDGTNATANCTWENKTGIVEVTINSIKDADGNSKEGQPIEFSISDYEADGRTGETITKVNFGKTVYFK